MFDAQQRGRLRVFGAQWNAERQRYTCQRGVDAALEHTDPENQADDHVRRNFHHPHAVHHDQRRDAGRSQQQRQTGQFAGVEDRNDDDGTQVVDDRQSHQKQLQRHRDALAEQGQYAKGEGDVGGHRDRPTVERIRIVLVEEPVNQRWDHHPANRRRARQYHLGGFGQMTFKQLAFDLQTYQ